MVEPMAYHKILLMKTASKFSNSRFVGHQSSFTVKIKQVSTMWIRNPTSSPQYKMRVHNGLTYTTRNNKSLQGKTSHKPQVFNIFNSNFKTEFRILVTVALRAQMR